MTGVQTCALPISWAERAETLCGRSSTGATTALAVTVFRKLDRELSKKSDGAASLDNLLPLIANSQVDLESLTEAVVELIGETPDALHSDELPGCRTMAARTQEPGTQEQ